MTDHIPKPLQLTAKASQRSNEYLHANASKRYKKTDLTTTVANQLGSVRNATFSQKNRASFLQKTHSMITHCDKTVAKWTTDGNRFVIMNIEKFEKEIIPQHFDHSRFSSFERQLNYYGFNKVQDDHIRPSNFDDETEAFITFMNENFKRDKPDLFNNIQRRTKVKVGKTQRILEELEIKVTKLNDNIDSLNAKLVGKVKDLRPRLIALERLMLKKGYEMDPNNELFLKDDSKYIDPLTEEDIVFDKNYL